MIKKVFSTCPYCGKKGYHRFQLSRYAGMECRYCKRSDVFYHHVHSGAWVKKGVKVTPSLWDEIMAYLKSVHYQDTERRYSLPDRFPGEGETVCRS